MPAPLAAARARRRAGGLRYGRRRAAARQNAPGFEVHPGWRGRLPTDAVVVTDQRQALQQVHRAVDAQLWSPRQRAEWTTMLTAMVHAMDWDTGLIIGVTREQLAALVGRSVRSVSRMWSWAQDSGLLARVEQGASGSWLGTSTNRSASFAILTTHTEENPPSAGDREVSDLDAQGVDQCGNPPPHLA